MRVLAVVALLSLVLVASEAVRVQRCVLATELKFQGMDGYLGFTLPDWLCIAHHVSDFNIQPSLSKTAEKAYGIFGFNNKYWCSDGVQSSSNHCNISCQKFLDDDIRDDVLCAREVLTMFKGLQAWPHWADNCRGKDLSSYLKDCEL